MVNRLRDAISPYLRSHADNPVDWFPWGAEAFDEARRRDVPVLVSIGYSTCHWCHVMARESFSDPELAAVLNDGFVAIKVDREENPEVDAVYLAAAGAFTQNLGWPLNVFVTPEGKAFHAGTYSPPVAIQGHPSFRQLLDAVSAAWSSQRGEIEASAAQLTAALAAAQLETAGLETAGLETAGLETAGGRGALPAGPELDRVVEELEAYEDEQYGGFGGAPKFPVAPVLGFLERRRSPLATRTLEAMAGSRLRDPVEGGYFRYAVNRDWTEPHYERMLYDNAQLLELDARAGLRKAAEGVANFLTGVLQREHGGFGSAQDSESTVDGRRVEGGYYALDAAGRSRQEPPAVDEKVLAGWNGLAIGALARSGFALGQQDWLDAAGRAADYLLQTHLDDGMLTRVSIDGVVSSAPATLEDYGMLAGGLLALSAASGAPRYAVAAKALVDAVLAAGFRAPGGGDPVLSAQGLELPVDPSEGAYPSGLSATADAAIALYQYTAERRYLDAATDALGAVAQEALLRPISYGASLAAIARLAGDTQQLVIVLPDGQGRAGELIDVARGWADGIVAVVTESEAFELSVAGFDLFIGRLAIDGLPTAYLCRDFVCRLPLTDPADLALALRQAQGTSAP